MKPVFSLFGLFIFSQALADTCALPAIDGRLINKTQLPIERLHMKLEIYSPKKGDIFRSRGPEAFKKSVLIQFEKDGTYHIPELTIENVDGLYVFPDFYDIESEKPFHSLGVTKFGLFSHMTSVTAFLCKNKKSYIKEYKGFFSQLELRDFGNISAIIKTPSGEEFRDFISDLFKQNRPEYLSDDFTYQLNVSAYLKVTGRGTDRSLFEGYVNDESFLTQGLKSCSSFYTCLANSDGLEEVHKNEFPLHISKSDLPFLSLSPLMQLSGDLQYELMTDFKVHVFKKGDLKIHEVVFFRKNNERYTLLKKGTLEEVDKKYDLVFENPVFCKPQGTKYCI